MQPEQRRKRKRFLKLKPPFFISSSLYYCFKCSSLFLFLAFFFFFNGLPSRLDLIFRPVFSLATSLSLNTFGSSNPTVEDLVLFPDHVLILVSKRSSSSRLTHQGFVCVYRENSPNSSNQIAAPVLSVDEYNEFQSIARCPLPPSNYSTTRVELRKRGASWKNVEDESLVTLDQKVHSWETLAYAALLDRQSVVVFVKGLNLRPDRVSDPDQFICHFNWDGDHVLTTHAITSAQEIVRCSLPRRLQKDPGKARGVGVSVSLSYHRALVRGRRRGRAASLRSPIPTVAKIIDLNFERGRKKRHELCVCTMLWNQAPSLREWIVYHAWLGVERWFVYDNNSDDDIEIVIDELEQENYNVSRHVWPWIKSQEAGFSHCILRARNECKWVAFMDVDEFYYFPLPTGTSTTAHPRKTSELVYPGRQSLRSLVAKFSSSKIIGEIRTVCHSFGPSGLISPPSQGVTAGYTCRLQSPERHKSIVRPDFVDENLLNVVHHFHLRRGYRYLNLPQNIAVINHYKYQVWETFRSKFFRRVATYVTDWQENQNEGSKDRAPGLGTEAIEPPNWRLQFCDVWDTGLRDVVIANLADPISGLLPWEKSRF